MKGTCTIACMYNLFYINAFISIRRAFACVKRGFFKMYLANIYLFVATCICCMSVELFEIIMITSVIINRFFWGASQNEENFISFYLLKAQNNYAINFHLTPFIRNNYFQCSLRKLYFYFLSHWMGYDCGDSFLFDFEPNWIHHSARNQK